MKNTLKLKAIQRIAGIITLIAIIGFAMVACDMEPKDNSSNYLLVGVWRPTSGNTGWQHTVSGSTGVISAFGTPSTIARSAIEKGFIKIGDENWRHIVRTGNLTWSGQERVVTSSQSSPNVATSTVWTNCTFTMAADEQTIYVEFAEPVLEPLTWTRVLPGGGTAGKLTITGLPSGGSYALYVFPSEYDVSTVVGVTSGIAGDQIGAGQVSGNVFTMYNFPDLTPFTLTGSRPVVLQNINGDQFNTANPMWRCATVNFTNGGATVNFSSFTAVTTMF